MARDFRLSVVGSRNFYTVCQKGTKSRAVVISPGGIPLFVRPSSFCRTDRIPNIGCFGKVRNFHILDAGAEFFEDSRSSQDALTYLRINPFGAVPFIDANADALH